MDKIIWVNSLRETNKKCNLSIQHIHKGFTWWHTLLKTPCPATEKEMHIILKKYQQLFWQKLKSINNQRGDSPEVLKASKTDLSKTELYIDQNHIL